MATQIKVWDPLVRLFHWTVLAAFLVAYLVEDEVMPLHAYVGYTLLGLVLVRIAWGFVGSHYARFAEFVRGPREVVAYLRAMPGGHAPRFIGHNPAGGAMILALLAGLLATTATGLIAYGIEGSGPLGQWPVTWSAASEVGFEKAHEFFADFTAALALLHLAGVVAGSLLHKENLVRSMVTGRKNAD